jgi:hypothetical protein
MILMKIASTNQPALQDRGAGGGKTLNSIGLGRTVDGLPSCYADCLKKERVPVTRTRSYNVKQIGRSSLSG